MLIQAAVGPADGPGEETFDFVVATPSWVAENTKLEKGFAFLRHHLLVRQWDRELVERAIADRCRRTEGADWNEIASALSRYGRWEFEDYMDSELPQG